LKNASTQNFFWKRWQLKFSSPRASLKSSLDVTVDRNTSYPEERAEVTNRPDVPVLTLHVRFGPNHGLEKSSPDLPAFPCWFRAGVSRAS